MVSQKASSLPPLSFCHCPSKTLLFLALSMHQPLLLESLPVPCHIRPSQKGDEDRPGREEEAQEAPMSPGSIALAVAKAGG